MCCRLNVKHISATNKVWCHLTSVVVSAAAIISVISIRAQLNIH